MKNPISKAINKKKHDSLGNRYLTESEQKEKTKNWPTSKPMTRKEKHYNLGS